MCYYTITLDRSKTGEGHTRAIMIVDAKDKNDAEARFLLSFGPQYYKELETVEGIHVPQGFDRLLTEQARKYILKVKSKAEDAPPSMSYQNMIHLNYA